MQRKTHMRGNFCHWQRPIVSATVLPRRRSMPRAIWKGSISFGLVNIPVGLYSATRGGNEVKFRMLRDSDHSPIKYRRVAEADDEEVDWEHIVKGYEYEKGQFL